jgi:hypothetical protein
MPIKFDPAVKIAGFRWPRRTTLFIEVQTQLPRVAFIPALRHGVSLLILPEFIPHRAGSSGLLASAFCL